MKKGQGQLVAFVLLVGFVVVLALLVGNWMMKQSQKLKGGLETQERITLCNDVAIVEICENGVLKIKNKGLFTISKLKINGEDSGPEIPPNGIERPTKGLISDDAVIPFIKVEGKETGCSTKSIAIKGCAVS